MIRQPGAVERHTVAAVELAFFIHIQFPDNTCFILISEVDILIFQFLSFTDLIRDIVEIIFFILTNSDELGLACAADTRHERDFTVRNTDRQDRLISIVITCINTILHEPHRAFFILDEITTERISKAQITGQNK